MSFFAYKDGAMHAEGVALAAIAAQVGTPFYCYSAAALRAGWKEFADGIKGMNASVAYAMKANSSQAVIRLFGELGAGADIVSVGEMKRALAAGIPARRIIYSGVGKKASELMAALEAGVGQINVESSAELETLNAVAGQLGLKADITIRVNPDVDAKTHAKITTGRKENKFGIDIDLAREAFALAGRLPNLNVVGVAMHIGSQLTDVKPFELAVKKVVPLAEELKAKHDIEFFSVGGGVGIVYEPALASGAATWWEKEGKNILTPQKYAAALLPLLKPLGLKILMEPGRYISGNSGILVTRVEYVKRTGKKNFVIVDGAMNDLIRPAFYDAYHEIVPLTKKGGAPVSSDVVGPVCESGDYFCKDRPLPKVGEGDHLALLSAGAYGFVMASNYNTRSLAAEVLVSGKKAAVVRTRQPIPEIWAGESVASWLK